MLGGSLLAGTKAIELWPEGVPGLRPDPAPERIENNRIVGIHYPSLVRFDPEPGFLHCPLKALTPVARVGGKIRAANQANIAVA